jgi:type I restriction enzyme M protein
MANSGIIDGYDFDKVKTQNILREEHIEKIVSTYRNRTETEKS